MMPDSWSVEYLPDASEDFDHLVHSQQLLVSKAIQKVSRNPLPQSEGGYGKPLRGPLAGLCKIKLRGAGLRVVYKLERVESRMVIVVISIRDDGVVYDLAEKRNK